MDLYIETLTGTAFELRVSPFDTVMSIKAKIQRLEGIPISQQHLIWQSAELDDELCLHDFDITDGATLKLVLAMRGGPINTRRISVEEPSLEEMAEYMEANRLFFQNYDLLKNKARTEAKTQSEILDKLMKDNRQVTLLVFRDGDQLNFFRVYDRGDGTLTPLSESLSAASMYNLYDEEDDEEHHISKEKKEENDETKRKMQILRAQMAKLNVKKQPKFVPRPPSTGRPNSNLAKRRLRFSTTHAEEQIKNTLSVDQKRERRHGRHKSRQSRIEDSELSITETKIPLPPVSEAKIPLPPVTSKNRKNDHVDISDIITASNFDAKLIQELTNGSLKSEENERKISSQGGYQNIKDISKRSARGTQPLKPLNIRDSGGHSRLKRENTCPDEETPVKDGHRSMIDSEGTVSRELRLASLLDSEDLHTNDNSHSTTNLESRQHRKSHKLKPNHEKKLLSRKESSESGKRLLRRAKLASMEESIVGLTREHTNKGLSIGREKLNPSRLPQMEPISKAPPQLVPNGRKRARCFLCSKKLGLATNYQCRCGNIFCTSHRYAEAHSCTYDYKGEGRKVLEQSNPVVTAPKLPKI